MKDERQRKKNARQHPVQLNLSMSGPQLSCGVLVQYGSTIQPFLLAFHFWFSEQQLGRWHDIEISYNKCLTFLFEGGLIKRGTICFWLNFQSRKWVTISLKPITNYRLNNVEVAKGALYCAKSLAWASYLPLYRQAIMRSGLVEESQVGLLLARISYTGYICAIAGTSSFTRFHFEA